MTEDVVVRSLRASDLAAVVAVDEKVTGRRREEFFRLKLQQALADTGIALSLAAEADGAVVGFMLARVYYGEFGVMEPVAVLDVLGVQPAFQGRGVARALLDQLGTNLRGLGIPRLRTEVAWEAIDLLRFFHHEGFRPAPRLCLDLDLSGPR
jgi:ribosomal protein S18 acetylase RimI-like enzyme